MKFSIKDFFSNCDQTHRKLRIWSHLLKKFLMENFIFCAVIFTGTLVLCAALRGLSVLISLRTSPTPTKENSKWDLVFRFLTAKTLGCLSCFSTILRLDLLSLLLRDLFHYIQEFSSFLQCLKRMNSVPQLLWCIV